MCMCAWVDGTSLVETHEHLTKNVWRPTPDTTSHDHMRPPSRGIRTAHTAHRATIAQLALELEFSMPAQTPPRYSTDAPRASTEPR